MNSATHVFVLFISRGVRIAIFSALTFGLALRMNTSAGCSFNKFVEDTIWSSWLPQAGTPSAVALETPEDLCPPSVSASFNYAALLVLWYAVYALLLRPCETALSFMDHRAAMWNYPAHTVALVLTAPYAGVLAWFYMGYAAYLANSTSAGAADPLADGETPLALFTRPGPSLSTTWGASFVFVWTLILFLIASLVEVLSAIAYVFSPIVMRLKRLFAEPRGEWLWVAGLVQERTVLADAVRVDSFVYTTQEQVGSAVAADIAVEEKAGEVNALRTGLTYDTEQITGNNVLAGAATRIFFVYLLPFLLIVLYAALGPVSLCPIMLRTTVLPTACAPMWVAVMSYSAATYVGVVIIPHGVIPLLLHLARPSVAFLGPVCPLSFFTDAMRARLECAQVSPPRERKGAWALFGLLAIGGVVGATAIVAVLPTPGSGVWLWAPIATLLLLAPVPWAPRFSDWRSTQWAIALASALFASTVLAVYLVALLAHAGAATGVWVPIEVTTHPLAQVSWAMLVALSLLLLASWDTTTLSAPISASADVKRRLTDRQKAETARECAHVKQARRWAH